MSKSRYASLLFLLAAAMASGPPLCRGQIPLGQILGTITDSTGAVVPGANVVLEDELKGTQQTTISGEAGIYTFSYLNSGTYRVSVEQAGFKKAVPGIKIEVWTRARRRPSRGRRHLHRRRSLAGLPRRYHRQCQLNGLHLEVIGMPLNGREFSQLAASCWRPHRAPWRTDHRLAAAARPAAPLPARTHRSTASTIRSTSERTRDESVD
jgi:hypothetical protein